jgi:hypothetical protein
MDASTVELFTNTFSTRPLWPERFRSPDRETRRSMGNLSARVSLIVLSLGFFLLGLLSLLKNGEAVSAADRGSALACSAVCFFLSLLFSVASCLYWKQLTAAKSDFLALSPNKAEQNKNLFQ